MVPVTEIRITDPMTAYGRRWRLHHAQQQRAWWIQQQAYKLLTQDTNNETYYLNHLITIVEGEGLDSMLI